MATAASYARSQALDVGKISHVKKMSYEYGGLMAASWDLLRGDTSSWPDLPFYRAAILRCGQPVLDVGCGTGRLLLDFLSEGLDIDGVDNSPEMLALCRQKAERRNLMPALFHQPMERLQLPRRYRTIIVPSSSLQLVTDQGAAVEAMRRLFDHLESGGTLVAPFMILWSGQTISVSASEWRLNGEAVRPDDGAVVRRWSRSGFDTVTQLQDTEDRYEVLRGGDVAASEHHSRSPATRQYTQDQAIELFRAAGFANIHVVSAFTEQPPTRNDRIFSVFGTRQSLSD
jgi:SAM-dependent methyltransferase